MLSKFTHQHHGPETVAHVYSKMFQCALLRFPTYVHILWKETPPLYKYAYLQPQFLKMFPAENHENQQHRRVILSRTVHEVQEA